jgi:2Fe-2S ferredoxin
MPIIHFARGRAPVTVEAGANLMNALLATGVPVASSCRGDGVCAKCRIRIVEGARNLSPEGDVEKFLREKFQIPKNERVSCQTLVNGDITVDASYW